MNKLTKGTETAYLQTNFIKYSGTTKGKIKKEQARQR